MSATRRMPVPPAAVWAVLSDPARHQETEPGDWVRDAIDPAPLTEVGQVFGMNMGFPQNGEPYVMHNRVIALEPERVIAWAPGQLRDGELPEDIWWTWHYELAPVDGGTDVTLTYDWTDAPAWFRAEVPLPAFGVDFLEESLASLEKAAS
ncbi:SRPBCC family protein [Kytococcus sedentarius]|uniref:SRPBCC family protein n=1 Tax=Kytococcus sedentarius TaxID=1276 RepID=UPI0035BC2AD3